MNSTSNRSVQSGGIAQEPVTKKKWNRTNKNKGILTALTHGRFALKNKLEMLQNKESCS
jgi:hypothetical protein